MASPTVIKQEGNGPIDLRRQLKLQVNESFLAGSEATTASKQPRRVQYQPHTLYLTQVHFNCLHRSCSLHVSFRGLDTTASEVKWPQR